MGKIIDFLRLIRITNLLIVALSLSCFYYLVIVPVHSNVLSEKSLLPFTNMAFFLFTLAVVFIAAAGNIINDYFDFELDKEYKPGRPLPKGLMSLDAAMYVHAAFLLAGIGLGFYVSWLSKNYHLGYLFVMCAVLLFLYSSFLKKVPLAGNVLVAGLSAFVFALLLIFETSYLRLIHANDLYPDLLPRAMATLLIQFKFYAGFAFTTSLAREIIKDMEDADGDAAFNLNTFAVAYGKNVAKILAVLVMLCLLAGLAYFINIFYQGHRVNQLLYLTLALALPVVVIICMTVFASQAKDYGRISLLLKVVMLLGVLTMPVFYWLAQIKVN